MTVTAGFMVPHPPLIVPEIGKGEERGIRETTEAYEKAAGEIAVPVSYTHLTLPKIA